MPEKQNNPLIILGIDPGTVILGYGLIRIQDQNPEVLTMGVVKLHKLNSHYEKLGLIYRRIEGLIQEYRPDAVALEAPFFGKNVQSMLKLGRAQGMAMAPAINLNLPVFEYAPRKIKQSITGNGNASKEQVANLLGHILKMKQEPDYLDATDALAAALCHFYQMSRPVSTSGYSGWKEFIRKNPGRIK